MTAPRSACVIGAVGTAKPEAVTVATTSPINPSHAPRPTNSGERVAFAQLYETLINVDCDGRAYPGLAQSWQVDATKTRVTLVLRDDAKFWNGDAVGARDVLASWQADSSQLARRIAEGTTIVDDRTLTVSLPDTDSLVLADPALAISRPSVGSSWPRGSGPYRISESAMDVAPGGGLALVSVGGGEPRIVIRSGPDARDAIDGGADVLVTADPTALAYAGTRPDLTSVPLPWQRTYVLAVSSRAPNAVADALSSTGDAASLRASLARDAVRAEARGAEQPEWWTTIQGCELRQPTASAAQQRGRRIVYRGDDPVARGLAERLVAISRGVTVSSLAPPEFATALRNGNELAYVVALPRTPLTPCRDADNLVSSAPWLAGAMTEALVPLVDTRDRAILRRDHVSAAVDWDGTLRFGATRP
ncbi:MAG TPA: ABC transporter substrate-binding protein [Gemmatimonadaceae bacterium]